MPSSPPYRFTSSIDKETNISFYSGCHKYVPFARFPNRRKSSVQRIEIITNMTTAMLLERLVQAILAVSDNPEKTQQTAAIGTLF